MTTVSLRFRVGAKLLLHIIKERLSFHSAVNHTWRRHSVAAQSAHEGDRFPVATGTRPIKRSPRTQRPPTRIIFVLAAVSSMKTPAGPGQTGPAPHPAPTRPRHVGPLLLGGVQAFF